MKRKAHTLQRWGMGVNPDLFIVVQARAAQVYESDADATGHLELAEWSAIPMREDGVMLHGVQPSNGKRLPEFWGWLRAMLIGHHVIWIVSDHAREHIAMLGFWDKVLEDEIYIWRDRNDHYKPRRDGMVCLQGPPTIVSFTTDESEQHITWVDPANWGARGLLVCDEPWLSSHSPGDDCVKVAQWLSDYMRTLCELDIGAIEHTAAAQAMAGYRRKYLEARITVHDNEAVLAIERASLYAGRCEPFYLGILDRHDSQACDLMGDDEPPIVCADVGPIYHLDVNGLYPSVARAAELPIRLQTCHHNPDVALVLRAAQAFPVIADVELEVATPCVPVRIGQDVHRAFASNTDAEKYFAGETRPEVIYPCGRIRTVLCGPELSLAATFGIVHHVNTAAIYEGAVIYKQWVDDMHGRRLRYMSDGNETMADCCKAILNASFGKWAQQSKRWVPCPDEICPWPWAQWWQADPITRLPVQWRSFAWAVSRLERTGETSESCPAITAYIHSLGRARLWQLMELAGPGNVYYVDTDSLWVNHQGKLNLFMAEELEGWKLGKLKTVAEHTAVRFWGPKRYVADGAVTMAGANGPVKMDRDPFALCLKAPPLSHYLYAHKAPGLDRHTARARINLPYTLAAVRPDGWTRPFVLQDF